MAKIFFFHFFVTFTLVASIITKIDSFLSKAKTIMINFIKMFIKSANLAIKKQFLEIIWSCLGDEIFWLLNFSLQLLLHPIVTLNNNFYVLG
jgi:hypothetical protein